MSFECCCWHVSVKTYSMSVGEENAAPPVRPLNLSTDGVLNPPVFLFPS